MLERLHPVRTVVRRLIALLPVLLAVGTIPVALLSLINLDIVNALEVLVNGLLLLTPLSALLAWVVLGLSPVDLPWGLAERSVDLPGVTVSTGADRTGHASGTATAEDGPVALLRERFARGEIDQAEFEARLDRLIATEDAPAADGRPEASREPARSAMDVGSGTDREQGPTEQRSPTRPDREPEST